MSPVIRTIKPLILFGLEFISVDLMASIYSSQALHKVQEQELCPIEITKMALLYLNKKQLAVSSIIASLCFIGDKNTENQENPLVNAICDNLTHICIGIFTYIGLYIPKISNFSLHANLHFFLEIILCGVCSSLIDVDHFIAAKSFSLKDAVSLKSRPFMHCTTLVLFIVLTVLLFSYFFKVNWLYKLGWILAAAFLSHHIRDSKRRGFWLWPLGHTLPIPLLVYLPLQMFLPQIISLLISKFPLPEVSKSESFSTLETV